MRWVDINYALEYDYGSSTVRYSMVCVVDQTNRASAAWDRWGHHTVVCSWTL